MSGASYLPIAGLGFLLVAACGQQPSGYTVADPNRLPRMSAGLTLKTLPVKEVRDCEGPWCEVHALVLGAPADGSDVLSALTAVFTSSGWKQERESLATPFRIMCKPGYTAYLWSSAEYKGEASADIAADISRIGATAAIDLLPRSCAGTY